MPKIELETDREPDFTLKVWLVLHGYEAKAYSKQRGFLFSRGRDWEKTIPIKDVRRKLEGDVWYLLEHLHIGLDE